MKLLLVLAMFLAMPALADANRDSIKYIPIQNGGRIKPFDTFAKETLQLLHGKRSLSGQEAVDIVLTIHMVPELWNAKNFIEIKNRELKKELQLTETQDLFSPNEILSKKRLSLVMQKLSSKRQTQEKLIPYYQAIQKLEGQIYTYRALVSGDAFTLVPPVPGKGSTWLGINSAPDHLKALFSEIGQGFAVSVSKDLAASKSGAALDTPSISLSAKVAEFKDAAKAQNPELYGNDKDMSLEVKYNNLQPFMWGWITYLMAALFFLFAWFGGRGHAYRVGFAFLLTGFVLHCIGFGLRIYITGRPPVSNMYESVIWVSLGAILFSTIIDLIYKQTYILVAGCIVAILCLVVADLAPTILDPSLQPLEPVLVSSFWLIIHVMTISISYSAFFLALALGNIGLVAYIRGEDQHKKLIKGVTNAIYRSIQIGVILLAAGIILGGVWADYSWGRFWGWDPKETWALIALLGYLALLHGRIGGWLKDFGMNVGAVVGFSLIIMAWYGVNYVLGAGLHSYGFGGGGKEYVAGFVGLQLLLVVYASYVRKLKRTEVTV